MVVNTLKKIVLNPEKFTKNEGIAVAESLFGKEEDIKLLLNTFLSSDMRFRQRSVWVLLGLITANRNYLKTYESLLIETLLATDEDSLKRNILRLLQYFDINTKYHGPLIDYCFAILTNRKEPIAVHVFAMTVLAKLIKTYPDLQNELITVLEDNMAQGSAGYKSRANKILAELHPK